MLLVSPERILHHVREQENGGEQDLKALIPNDSINSKLLYYLLKSKEVDLLSKVTRGATVHRLQSDLLKMMKICFPPPEKQMDYIIKLDALSEETKRLEAIYQRKLDALAELKQSLLQRAFTGKL